MDAIVPLELTCGLDTLPGGSYLNEDALLFDADAIIECDELLGFGLGSFFVKGKRGINFRGNTAGDDLEDGLAKLDQLYSPCQHALIESRRVLKTYQAIHGCLNLRWEVTTLALAVLDSGINQLGIVGLVRRCEDKRGVRSSILQSASVDTYIFA